MMAEDLLAAARRLAQSQTNKPRQAFLRRAASTAYYAAFHALADHNARQLIGGKKSKTEAWRSAYRALQHGKAKDALKQASLRQLHPDLARFANAFITLQEVRHEADYDPHRVFSRAEVLSLIAQSRRAIEVLAEIPPDIRLELTTRVLFRARQQQ
jgi:uncharacterized protein (UPF0332 family)